MIISVEHLFLELDFNVSKLATVVESDQKAPFSIAPLYSWYVPYIAEW